MKVGKMDESGWKGMKMDENGWKWMKVNENGWKWIKWMKVDENGWKWIKMDENGLKTIINFIPITIPMGKDDIQNFENTSFWSMINRLHWGGIGLVRQTDKNNMIRENSKGMHFFHQ